MTENTKKYACESILAEHTLAGLTQNQLAQIQNFLLGKLVTSLAIINQTRSDLNQEEAFGEAKYNAFNSLVSKFLDLASRADKKATEAAKYRDEFKDNPKALDRLEKLIKDSAEKSKFAADKAKILTANEDKIMEQVLGQFEQLAGVSKRTMSPQTTPVTGEEQEAVSIKEKLQGVSKKLFDALGFDTAEDVEEDEGKSAPGLSKSHHSDDFYFTIDPVDSTSDRLRRALMNLPLLDSEGNVKKNFFGEPVYADIQDTFRRLHALLDGSKPIFKNQMETLMKKYVDDPSLRTTSAWLPAFIVNSMSMDEITSTTVGTQFIEAAFSSDPSTRNKQIAAISGNPIQQEVKNEFASNMAQHKLTAPIVDIKVYNGKVSVRVFEQNRNTLIAIVRQEMYVDVKNKLYVYDPKSGDYIPDEEAITAAMDLLMGYRFKGVPETAEQFRKEFETFMGVSFSSEAVEFFYENGVRILGPTKKPVKFTDKAILNGNNSPFVIMLGDMENILRNKVPFSVKNPISGGMFGKLMKIEANLSKQKRIANTFVAGDRTISTFTANKYFNTQLADIFEDLDRLENTIFTERSYWLDLISTGKLDLDNTEVQYLNFNPLKLNNQGEAGDFNDLKDKEHTLVKNALLTHSTTKYPVNHRGFGLREATFVPLTFSDKDTVLAVKGLALIMKFDELGNISDEVVDLFYENVVMAEIDRIWLSTRHYKRSSEAGRRTVLFPVKLSRVNEYFFLFPEFNELLLESEGEDGTRMHIYLNECIIEAENHNDITLFETVIKQRLKEVLNTLIDEKLNEFNNDTWLLDRVPTLYKEFLVRDFNRTVNSKRRVDAGLLKRLVATDIALNHALAAANALQLFAGDPALYADIRPYELSAGASRHESIKNIVQQCYWRLNKRVASLIAPGVELSRLNDNEVYIQLFAEDISRMKYPYKSDLLNNQIQSVQSESLVTDGQEYITWQEYLQNQEALGRLTKDENERLAWIFKNAVAYSSLSRLDRRLLLSLNFSIQKPLYVGDEYVSVGEKNFLRRVYIKSSALPLIPQLTLSTELDRLRIAMERVQEITGKPVRLAFRSAVKLGYPRSAKDVHVVNVDGKMKRTEELIAMFCGHTSSESNLEEPYLTLRRKYLRLQITNTRLPKFETVHSIQLDRILLANLKEQDIELTYNRLFLSIEELFKHRSRTFTGEPIENEKYSEDEFASDIGNIRRVINQLVLRKAKTKGVDQNLWYTAQNAVPDSLNIHSRFIQSVYSEAVLKVTKRKVAGGTYIATSGAMFGRDLQGLDNSDIIWTDGWCGKLLPMRMSDDASEVLPAQVIVSSPFVDGGGELLDLRQFTFLKDGRRYLDRAKLSPNALHGVCYRMPVTDLSACAYIEVVGILPVYVNNVMVVPDSFVSLMGVDFDMDTIHCYFYNTSINQRMGESFLDVGFDKHSEHGLQNRLLQSRIEALQNPTVFALEFTEQDRLGNSLRLKSDFFQSVSLDVNEIKSVVTHKSKIPCILSGSYQKTKYLEGQSLKRNVTNVMALLNFVHMLRATGHGLILAKKFGFSLKHKVSTIGVDNGIEQYSSRSNKSYRRVRRVIQSFLAAAFESSEKDVLLWTNLNRANENAAHALMLLGFREEFIVLFLNLPIIQAISQDASRPKAKGLDFYLAERVSKAVNELHGIATEKFFTKDRLPDASMYLENSTAEFNRRYGDLNTEEFETLFLNVIKGKKNFTALENLVMLNKFSVLFGIMKEVKAIMRLTSHNFIMKQYDVSYLEQLREQFQIVSESRFIRQDSVKKLVGSYQFEMKDVKPAIKFNHGAFEKRSACPFFDAAVNAVKTYHCLIAEDYTGISKVLNALKASKFIKASALVNYRDVEVHYRAYLFSSATLFNGHRLSNVFLDDQASISTARKLLLAKTSPKLKNNLLIRYLEVFIDQVGPHRIEFRNSANYKLGDQQLAVAFLELLDDSKVVYIDGANCSSKELAEELVAYAFLIGGAKTAVDFVRFVPMCYLFETGFYEKIVRMSHELSLCEGPVFSCFVEQFCQHKPLLLKQVAFDFLDVQTNGGVVKFIDKKATNRVTYNPKTGEFIDELATPKYITTSMKGQLRILSQIESTNEYVLLDKLGSNAVKEYSYGQRALSNFVRNQAKTAHTQLGLKGF